jgi:flagellar FliL protein
MASDSGTEAQPRRRPWGLLAAVVVVALLGVIAFLLLRPTSVEAAAEPQPPELGAVVKVEPISINLTDGHYLRMGFGIQLTADAGEGIETARALDIAIATFSGRSVGEVNDPVRRAELKADFVRQLSDTFDGKVVDVYLTDFVTQ